MGFWGLAGLVSGLVGRAVLYLDLLLARLLLSVCDEAVGSDDRFIIQGGLPQVVGNVTT